MLNYSNVIVERKGDTQKNWGMNEKEEQRQAKNPSSVEK